MPSNKTAPKSAGRRSSKFAGYYGGRYLQNKLGRILRSHGSGAATEWTKGPRVPLGAVAVLKALLNRPGVKVRQPKVRQSRSENE